MALIIMLAIIGIWIYVSGKLPKLVQRSIIIIVDAVAVVMFFVVSLELFERIILLFAMVMMAIFWIAKDNRFNTNSKINWKQTKIADLLCYLSSVMVRISVGIATKRTDKLFLAEGISNSFILRQR